MVRTKERRRRQRVDLALPIKIRYNKQTILTQTKNISVLGTYIEINKQIPIGADVAIQIKLPKTRHTKDRQINCTGTVFRCQRAKALAQKVRFGVGIFFRSFSGKCEKNLAKYIDDVIIQEKKIGKIFMRRIREKRSKQKKGVKI